MSLSSRKCSRTVSEAPNRNGHYASWNKTLQRGRGNGTAAGPLELEHDEVKIVPLALNLFHRPAPLHKSGNDQETGCGREGTVAARDRDYPFLHGKWLRFVFGRSADLVTNLQVEDERAARVCARASE